jgi:hypothetical protein
MLWNTMLTQVLFFQRAVWAYTAVFYLGIACTGGGKRIQVMQWIMAGGSL